jgi:lipoprotein-releasing system permease protein
VAAKQKSAHHRLYFQQRNRVLFNWGLPAYNPGGMSALPFELLLALRYLRPKRTFVSIITLISIVGVMLGVAVLIVVISVMTGFDRELRDKILGFNAHLRIAVYGGHALTNYEEVIRIVSSNRNVTAIAPYAFGQALLETQPENGESVFFAQYVRGVDPEAEKKITVLPGSVKEGQYNLRGNRILVGANMASDFNLQVGDKLAIYSPADLRKMKSSRSKEDAEAILPEDYEVSGIFDVGYYEFNSAFVITSLRSAQELFDLGDGVSGLLVNLRDPYLAEQVQRELYRVLPENCYIKTWLKENSTFFSALAVEKNLMFFLLFFIMIVAAFGIMSGMITFVVQKTREIGMLKALGATSGQIMWIFLGQSLMVGVLGVASGFGLGMLAVHYRNEFLGFLRRITGFELFPAKIYMFSELPAVISPQDIAMICGGSLLICILAGLLPAWNAGRLKPVEALRHE